MVKKIKLKYIIVYLFSFLFLLIIGSGNVISPFYGELNFIDEGQYLAWIGHMKNGEFLYKDTYAAYGPLLIFPYYIFSKLFDPSFFSIRIFYGVFGILISLSVVILILRYLKVNFLLQFYAIFMLLIIPGFGIRQASGLFAIFLCYLAFIKSSYWWMFSAGSALSISFLISSDIGLFSLITILFIFFINFINTEDFYIFFKRLFFFIIGLITVFGIFAIFSGIEGWFFSYANSILDDFKSYSGIGIPVGKSFPNIINNFPSDLQLIVIMKYFFSREAFYYLIYTFYLISYVYFLIKFLLKKLIEEDKLFFLITIYGFLISYTLIGRLGLNFVVTIVIINISFFLNLLLKKIKKKNSEVMDYFFSILLIGIILLFSFRLISIYRVHFYKIPQAVASVFNISPNQVKLQNTQISRDQYNDVKLIQNFINENTKPNEKIFFFSNNPGLYLLVNRVSPSRFDLPEVANTKEKRLEIIDDLEEDKTRYIIEYTKAYDVEGISNRIRLPEVMDYIIQNYDVEKLGPFIIYICKYSDLS